MTLALVGDRVDQVQRGEAVEAVLVLVALDGLLAATPGWPWARRWRRHQHGLAAGVVHEHALFGIDQQRFFDVGLDAQRAHQRFRLAEVLALDGGGAAARDHARDRIEVFVGLVVAVEIGGDALRQRRDKKGDRSHQRACRDELRA